MQDPRFSTVSLPICFASEGIGISTMAVAFALWTMYHFGESALFLSDLCSSPSDMAVEAVRVKSKFHVSLCEF